MKQKTKKAAVRTNKKNPSVEELAELIADELMTMYPKMPSNKATRLALMRQVGKGEQNLGGLCRDAVVGRVLQVLSS